MTPKPFTVADLKGAWAAIVTPFRQGEIDESGLKRLIEFQIQNGTDGIVVCGTTGESPTLSLAEKKQVMRLVLDTVNGRLPVMAGTGSNNTLQALEMTQYAREIGMCASLSVCPYYNKPTQEGIAQHFEFLAHEADLPIVLYNIPGRTGVNMSPQTILRLSEHRHIIGIKEASGSLEQVSQILEKNPANFQLLSGDDALTLPILALGGRGVISTTSNVAPRLMADLCRLALAGEWQEARRIHFQLYPLFQALFCESNPVPVKTALSFMGVMTNEVRLPLTLMTPEHTEQVRQAVKRLNLIG